MRRNPRNRNARNKKKQDIDHKAARKELSIIIVILFILLILVSIFYFFKNTNLYKNLVETSKQEIENERLLKNEAKEKEDKKNIKEETDTTFTLSAIGDVMCHDTQYIDAYNADTNNYDFSYVFDEIKFYTQTADIAIGSLETSFAGEDRKYSNYPRFNSPDALAYSLKDIGIDVLSTAGNHCLDMGFDGLSRTIDVLNDADIAHLGTYKTQEDQNQVLFKYVKGVKIAFINYTYGTNGISIPKDKDFCVNLIDRDLIKRHIETAKSQNADMIVACMHWGTEYRTTANKEQEDLADFLFQNGVDIILGNHPHTLEPMEKRFVTLEDGSTKECFVIYALGNFICDQRLENTRNSIILNLTVTKHLDGKITIDKANYVPIYMYKDTSKRVKRMKLIDINTAIETYDAGYDNAVTPELYSLLKTELNKIVSIVGNGF